MRVGRRVELTVEAADEAAARAVVERLAGELLANPLIEAYAIESIAGRVVDLAVGGRGARPDDGPRRRRRLPGQQLRSRHASTPSSWPAPSRSSCGTSRPRCEGVAAVVLPGGFAYGDYLRAGVIARFSPVMRAVAAFAGDGGLVLGICNGFQVLAEAGLVPGALLRNRDLRFLGRDVSIAAERLDTPFTHALTGRRPPLRMPIAHGEGCYFADDATLDALGARRQRPVPLRRRGGAAGRARTTAPRTRTGRCGPSPA